MTIGILAYGSLLDNPGVELACTVRRIEDFKTPFRVEFARAARTRDGAPTLVPVKTGGDVVDASVLVLKDAIDEECARNMLYRRETHQVGQPVTHRGSNWISTTPVPGLDVCLYTRLGANISPPERTVQHLAELAIKSASRPAGMERRDGISYLEAVKRRGVETPLMSTYEGEILSQSTAGSLADAWARARAAC